MSRQVGWSAPRSLEEFGKLLADLILRDPGELELDPESQEIAADLAVLNRRGFLTVCSQPGEPLDSQEGAGQRAFVDGLAEESLARRVGALTMHTDLLVSLYDPIRKSWSPGYHFLPVTSYDHRVFTWAGDCYPEDPANEMFPYLCNFIESRENLSIEGEACLRRAWYVTVIDPHWGRKRYLWNHLRRATNPRSQAPTWSVEALYPQP